MNNLINDIAGDMLRLFEDYQYWVIGMEKRGVNEDGSMQWVPRPGFTFEECTRRMSEMPASGSLESLRVAIEKARADELEPSSYEPTEP